MSESHSHSDPPGLSHGFFSHNREFGPVRRPCSEGAAGHCMPLPKKKRNKGTMLLALGWSQERIAHALGVAQPDFARELFSRRQASR